MSILFPTGARVHKQRGVDQPSSFTDFQRSLLVGQLNPFSQLITTETKDQPHCSKLRYGRPLGVIFPDGSLWKEQRRFVGRSLKHLGGDLGEGMEQRVVAETREVVRHLDDLLGMENETRVKLDDFFDLPCLNVMWSLVASGRFSYNDPALQKMIRLIDSFTMDPVVGPLVGRSISCDQIFLRFDDFLVYFAIS